MRHDDGRYRRSWCARAGLALATAALGWSSPSVAAEAPVATGRAAELRIAAPTGAAVHVDGTFVGAAPLDRPVEVEPGRHVVAVSMNGFEPRRETVRLEPGERRAIAVDLTVTDQRIASWILLGGGAAGVTAGIVFGALSVIELREGRAILDRSDDAPTPEDQRAYAATEQARDDYRLGSGIAAGIGLAALLVGGPLYLLDRPAAAEGTDDVGDGARGACVRCGSTGVGLVVTPVVGQRVSGGRITVLF